MRVYGQACRLVTLCSEVDAALGNRAQSPRRLQAFFLGWKKQNCNKQTGQARFPVLFKIRLLEILLSAELYDVIWLGRFVFYRCYLDCDDFLT